MRKCWQELMKERKGAKRSKKEQKKEQKKERTYKFQIHVARFIAKNNNFCCVRHLLRGKEKDFEGQI